MLAEHENTSVSRFGLSAKTPRNSGETAALRLVGVRDADWLAEENELSPNILLRDASETLGELHQWRIIPLA